MPVCLPVASGCFLQLEDKGSKYTRKTKNSYTSALTEKVCGALALKETTLKVEVSWKTWWGQLGGTPSPAPTIHLSVKQLTASWILPWPPFSIRFSPAVLKGSV
jgi:hypothetical protein